MGKYLNSIHNGVLFLNSHQSYYVYEPLAFREKHAVEVIGYFNVDEMAKWLSANATGRYSSEYKSATLDPLCDETLRKRLAIVSFENAADAMLFKLTWMGF